MAKRFVTFEDYKSFYNSDERFKEYIDRACKKHRVTVDEAIRFKLSQETADYYVDAVKDKISETGIIVGCGGADAPTGGDCK